jgi:hypothetical protein
MKTNCEDCGVLVNVEADAPLLLAVWCPRCEQIFGRKSLFPLLYTSALLLGIAVAVLLY